MSALQALAAQAARLNRQAGAPPIPSLFFFTDPERTPDPAAAADALPRGTAVVYRHFGAANRAGTARRLARIAKARGLVLLIAADPALAAAVGAAGVHWPQRLAGNAQRGPGLMTVSAHDAAGLAQAGALGADACVLAPIFPTRSGSGRAPLGLFRASWLARASSVPVVALGGVNTRTAAHLSGRGFAGLAAVEALTGA